MAESSGEEALPAYVAGCPGGYVCGGFGLLSKSFRVYCWMYARIAGFASRIDWVVSSIRGSMLLSILSIWRCEACPWFGVQGHA